jgi:hypothetical protein
MTTKQKETLADYKERITLDFAHECKKNGFDVYIAERGTYGFYTNGERVVSFSLDLVLSLSGNYEPSRESGTGWRMADGIGIKDAMAANAPKWTKNKNPIYTTPKKYLKTYQPSSKFTQI